MTSDNRAALIIVLLTAGLFGLFTSPGGARRRTGFPPWGGKPYRTGTGRRWQWVEIYDLVRRHGGTDHESTTLATIAIKESAGWDDIISPMNWNKTRDRGLFQLNQGTEPNDGIALNPERAVIKALELARSPRGFKHWATY